MHIWNDNWPHWGEFYSVLNNLDYFIQKHKIKVCQMKEKFGTLRIYPPYHYIHYTSAPSFKSLCSWHSHLIKLCKQPEQSRKQILLAASKQYLILGAQHLKSRLLYSRLFNPWRRYKEARAIRLLRQWLKKTVRDRSYLAHELLGDLDDPLVEGLLDPQTCQELGHPCVWITGANSIRSCHCCGTNKLPRI